MRRADLRRTLECTLDVLLCGGVKAGRLKTRSLSGMSFRRRESFGARTYLGRVNGFSARFLWCVDDALVRFLRCVVDVACVALVLCGRQVSVQI